MPPVVQVDRAALWEVELPSLVRHRERSPFGKDCSLSLCILEVGDTLWGRRSLDEGTAPCTFNAPQIRYDEPKRAHDEGGIHQELYVSATSSVVFCWEVRAE